jgi:hypothetical protein
MRTQLSISTLTLLNTYKTDINAKFEFTYLTGNNMDSMSANTLCHRTILILLYSNVPYVCVGYIHTLRIFEWIKIVGVYVLKQ